MSRLSLLRSVSFVAAATISIVGSTADPVTAQSTRWGGVYFGAHLGGAGSDADELLKYYDSLTIGVSYIDLLAHSSSSLAAGGHVGAQVQSGPWLGGIELSWSALDLDDTVAKATILYNLTSLLSVKSVFMASVRLGYAMDRALIYIKGGYASAEVNTLVEYSIPVLALAGSKRSSKREDGWNIGVGLEYAWTQNLIVGLQYDYVNIDYTDRVNVQLPEVDLVVHRDIDVDIHKLTARLSYKFN